MRRRDEPHHQKRSVTECDRGSRRRLRVKTIDEIKDAIHRCDCVRGYYDNVSLHSTPPADGKPWTVVLVCDTPFSVRSVITSAMGRSEMDALQAIARHVGVNQREEMLERFDAMDDELTAAKAEIVRLRASLDQMIERLAK